MEETKKFAIDLVKKSGEIAKKYFESGKFSIKEKSHIDLATEADYSVDKFIKEKLEKEFPTHKVLTEETAPKDYSHFKSTEYLWVLDPIDGTVNFSRGNPNFAVALALVKNQEVILGIIYSPILNKLYIGEKGKMPTENGKEIKVSEVDSVNRSVLLCDWAWAPQDRIDISKKLMQVGSNVRGIRSTECFVLGNMDVAKGIADLHMTIGQKPWDAAASSLIVETAGGKVTTLDGKPWNIFSEDILVSNSILHDVFLKMLQ